MSFNPLLIVLFYFIFNSYFLKLWLFFSLIKWLKALLPLSAPRRVFSLFSENQSSPGTFFLPPSPQGCHTFLSLFMSEETPNAAALSLSDDLLVPSLPQDVRQGARAWWVWVWAGGRAVPTSRPGCWVACGRWHLRWCRLSCLRHEAPAPCAGTHCHNLAVCGLLLSFLRRLLWPSLNLASESW